MGYRSGKLDHAAKALCDFGALGRWVEQEAQCHGFVLVSIASIYSSC